MDALFISWSISCSVGINGNVSCGRIRGRVNCMFLNLHYAW
jgi:hypothetical protein